MFNRSAICRRNSRRARTFHAASVDAGRLMAGDASRMIAPSPSPDGGAFLPHANISAHRARGSVKEPI